MMDAQRPLPKPIVSSIEGEDRHNSERERVQNSAYDDRPIERQQVQQQEF